MWCLLSLECSCLSGRPNAPSIPQLHIEGRVLHLNWTMPAYLAGLNSSFITYEGHDDKSTQKTSNSKIIIPYFDLLLGSETKYYISLVFSKDAKNGMCQGYKIPNVIKSPFSRKFNPIKMIGKYLSIFSKLLFIAFQTEFGAPIVNLTCPIVNGTKTVVHMDWMPTGSITPKEIYEHSLVSECWMVLNCSNGVDIIEVVCIGCILNCVQCYNGILLRSVIIQVHGAMPTNCLTTYFFSLLINFWINVWDS